MNKPEMPVTIVNAIIEETYLGNDEFGYLRYVLHIKITGNTSTSYGTHDLRFYGIDLINKLLATIGVGSWEKIPGTPIRIKKQSRMVIDIGNLLEDNWLDLEALANQINFNKAK